ncbi:putative WRKY transcription factor 41 [Bidens hawaiensis]|uniref:putative WRKY transcription factor 41 n=1 Tax=Bidens hawaiensis TaxID=980011 RepID=UPI00404AC1CA
MEKRPLMNELTQGRELANQLKGHLDKPMSPQACEFLVEKILSSYEKALSMLNQESTHSASSYSPHDHCNKKRKTMEKWSEQVKVCSGSMVEGPLSDGYSWRKYGQKDILGANHPRAYYRCTHRNVQGCLATKQVQRSDDDSSVFEVIYRGRHTCIQATQLSKALEKKPKKEEEKRCMDRVFSFKAYKAGDEGLFPSFSFASTPIETEKLENLFYLGCDFNHNLQSSDSDLSDIINSTPTSVTNSPFGGCDLDLDMDFSLDHDFDVTNSELFV